MQEKIMIDVGAATGTESSHWNGIVYAFEPCKRNYSKLRSGPKYIKINKAISDYNGSAMFYECNYTNSSSLLPFTSWKYKWKCPKKFTEDLQTIEEYEVQVTRLDTFIEANKLADKEIDYIKIDTQGNDYKVIQSLGKYIKNVKRLKCEVQITDFELYKDASKKESILFYMLENNFRLDHSLSWSLGQEEELIFVRKQ